MKIVSQAFLDTWAKKDGKPEVILVYYKRRYWNGAAYVYETDWKQITANRISNIGQITWKLDTPLLNNIKASNVSLHLKNTGWEWVEQNQTDGVFAPCTQTGNVASDPFLTKFKIQFGYNLPSGSTELVSIFTGVAIDYIHDTQCGYTEVMISGNEYLLQAANPRVVSDTFGGGGTPESCVPPTGDGTNKDFLTQSVGVTYIHPTQGVLVNNVLYEQGIDYTLSGLNTFNGAAMISFFDPVPNGYTVEIQNGLKWKQSQKIETLIGYLCDAAGITSGERTISPAIFPGGALARKIYQATSDWQNGTANMDFPTDPGLLVANALQILPGDSSLFTNSSLCGWGFAGGGFGHFSPNPTGDGFGEYYDYSGVGGEGNTLSKSFGVAYGQWSFDIRPIPYLHWAGYGWVFSANAVNLTEFNFIRDDSGLGYSIKPYQAVHDTDATITCTFNKGATVLLTFNLIVSAWNTILITRDYTGLFTISVGGVVQGTVMDTTYTTATNMLMTFSVIATGGGALPANIRNVDINAVVTNNWESIIDLVGPVSYGAIVATGSIPANTSVTIYTQSSTSNTPFNDPDGWKALGAGSTVQSVVREWFRIKVVMGRTGSYTITPSITKIVFYFVTAQVLLSLADFSNYATCFDAIQNLAQLCDYEWGFDSLGNFFFRSKAPGITPVVDMRPDNIISAIQDFRPGYDAVINNGQVTYNEYFEEYNSTSLPETSPTSEQRFLTLTKAEDWSSLLLAYDIDIAAGRSQVLHDNYYLPKRRCRIKGKIVPQLDLSDVVNVSYWENRLASAPAIWGDPMQKFGALPMGKGTNTLIDNMIAKIVGIVFDPISGQGEYDVQEVL